MNRSSTYTTQIGERRSIALADGSTIDLNARSTLRVNFSKTERNVELIDGQALFEVAKDKARPFIVRSGETVVRAVGTQFDVYHKKEGTTVTVIEGSVAVLTSSRLSGVNHNTSSADETPGPSIPDHGAVQNRDLVGKVDANRALLLSAGERVTVRNQTMSAPEPADVAAVTAWVQHRLVFDASH